MTRVLLIAPFGHGGEGVYLETLLDHPPDGTTYEAAGSFGEGSQGARCRRVTEAGLNRIVHRLAIPDMGFRALRLRSRFDLVHVHAHPVHLAGLRGTPVVMSEGSSSAVYLGAYLGWDTDRLARGYRRSRRMYRALGIHDRLLALEKVSRAYVFSNWARAINVRWGADPDKLDVVAPGFPTPPPVDRGGRDSFRFLFVGTDFERKGGFDVIEAFDALLEACPQARLTVVSSDPAVPTPDRLVHSWVDRSRRERLLARLESLCRSGHAEVYPLVARDVLERRFFPAADAYVMPTLAEGFGFTNVEAMSHGLPVVSSRVGPIDEIVTHTRSGLLVAPGAPAELRDAMVRLAGDPDAARGMGSAGHRDFLERFTLQRFQRSLGDVYRRALG